MSRLIVALCVVGCLYAVQAKPHIGKLGGEIERETKGFEAVPTDQLLNGAYDKLSTLLETFAADEVEALRKCLKNFDVSTQLSLYEFGLNGTYELNIVEVKTNAEVMTLEQLVKLARNQHIKIFDFKYPSKTEIEKTRATLIKFLNDPTPDITYHIKHSWCTLYDAYEVAKPAHRGPFLTFLGEMNMLYKDLTNMQRDELTNMIVNFIKRGDEKLVKWGGIENVERMIEYQPYKSLSSLPYNELESELSIRFEVFYKYAYKDKTGKVKNDFNNFVENFGEQIPKYHRIE